VHLPLAVRLGLGVTVAAVLAYAATPVAITAAKRWSLYDRPMGYKGHSAPTPYLGGAVVIVAFAIALVLGAGHPSRTLSLLAGVAVLLVLGTVDDWHTVTPRIRVATELTLGALLSAAGLGWRIGAGGVIDAVVTALWVLAVVNAFNLFDNLDGAATSITVAVAGGVGILALITGNPWVAIGSAALIGACIGFLPHNLASPARIFLGDGGSLPIGLAVAVLAAGAAQGAESSWLALLVGCLLVGVPVLDTCLVIVSRRRRGVSVTTPGRDHLTHRVRRRARTPGRVALVLGGAQAILSALTIIAVQESSTALVYVLFASVVTAASAIVVLERDAVVVSNSVSRRSGDVAATVGLALIGLGAGLSPLFSAYYNPALWVPLGLGIVIVAVAATVASPPRITRPMALALTGVAGLGFFSLLSTAWAPAVESGILDANLWLLYAALLLLMLVLLRVRRHVGALLIGVGVGITVVAASVLVRMLGSDPVGLFIAGRLNSPLGYVNGEGCVFAMGCWLSLAVAERREAPLAGLGAAGTVAMAGLALLSQSRGAAIATLVAVAVVLAAVPGLRRRVFALAFVAAGVGAASRSLLRVYSHGSGAVLTNSVVHTAGVVVLVASAAVGLSWGLVVAATNAIARCGGSRAGWLMRAATVLTVLALSTPLVAVVLRSSSVEGRLRTQWQAFVHLSGDQTAGPSSGAQNGVQTRLLSGGGNRYDYWRIAWRAFLAHPVAGVGAGSYMESYYRDRRTQESIENPHSIELQTLSELGLVGALLLAALVAGVLLGARRLRAQARRSRAARTAMVASVGVAVVWLVDTSGDWMHLLPGVTAIALAGIAVLCSSVWNEPEGRPPVELAPASIGGRGRPRVAGLLAVAGVAFALVVAGGSLMRQELVQIYVTRAQSELNANPAGADGEADQALRLNGGDLDAYYLKAAALARFDEAGPAQATLLEAARQDPGNFVTWELLGDLEVRAGSLAAAKVYYGRAHSLNPRDPTLRALATDPAGATR
jgi:UDP-GlcNAc:undecaprenyl-phosphate/decaprenyl-phosphate GlcNAc-1-phosphate transferase